MSLYRTLAWFDEELEADSLSSGIFTRLSLTYRVLSDIESEKRETRFAHRRIACVSDAGLAGLQFQSHVLEPFGKRFLTLLDDGAVLVQHHQIVGVSNHLRRIETLIVWWESAARGVLPCRAMPR